VRCLTACSRALLLPLAAHAGAQKYEPLSASVQAALSRSVSDRAPPRSSFQDSMDAIDWLTEMSRRLEKRIPDREARFEFLRSVHYEATRAGLDPQLVLGLIQVESGFKKYAVSSAGARGFMQVMPFWVKARRTQRRQPLSICAPICATGAPFFATTSTSSAATSTARSAATTAASASRNTRTWFAWPGRSSGPTRRASWLCADFAGGRPGAQRIPGIIPLMPRISCAMPPRENCFIIFWVCSNCLSRRLTSCT
jgi:hypothetical protein